eukprot:1819421-Pleurochrysis_carterae.AAC.1
MEGTQRTPVRVKSTTRLRESRAMSGKSPMATHGRGFPSTPDTDSEHGFKLIRSCKHGLRTCLSLMRAERVATRARALVEMRSRVHELRSAL